MALIELFRVFADEHGLPTGQPELHTGGGEPVILPGVRTVNVQYDTHDVTTVTVTFLVRHFEQALLLRDRTGD